MAGTTSEAGARTVPESQWSDALSRFSEQHRGSRATVDIARPDGSRHPIEPESHCELDLMAVGEERDEGRRFVRVVVHKHPGASIETVELEQPSRVRERPGAVSVESTDGGRLDVQVLPPPPTAG